MENNNETPKFKMPVVPIDALFNIEVSGFFLKRVQVLLMTYGETMGNEEFGKMLDRLKSGENSAETQSEETIWILVALIDAMEKSAKKAGLSEEKEISADDFYNMILPQGPAFSGS